MQAVLDAIERVPVATITHVLLVAFLGLYLLIHGSLPHDAQVFGAIAETGNIGVAGARAHVKAAKVKQPKVTHHLAPGDYFPPIDPAALGARHTGTTVEYAAEEPGDPDGLSHISTTNPGQVPPDEGDAGQETLS